MTEQRIVPLELLAALLDDVGEPIYNADNYSKLRSIIDGPEAPDGVVEALQSLKEQVAAIVCHKLGHPGTAMAVQESVIRLINRSISDVTQPIAK